MRNKHNLNPGPAVLPEPVLAECARAVLELNDTGLSLLEISHRSPEFAEIIEEAETRLRHLMNIPEDYHVLFLQGGARLQFAMIPMNFLSQGKRAGYVDTGIWASKAIEEAQKIGNVQIVASSKDNNYRHIPRRFSIPPDLAYLHITSNNTIYGTQWWEFPQTEKVPLIADMSSDILSRPIDVQQFAMIYAGAQKNAGTAGVTLVIIRADLLEQIPSDTLPTMLDYRAHVQARSLLNTPPVFSIYVTAKVLEWIQTQGGVPELFRRNQEKASIIYAVLDSCREVYEPHAVPEDRSIMNITFRLRDERLNDILLKWCQDAGIVGIKGHRSIGGFRASLYNALPIKSAEVLAEVLKAFAQRYG